MKTIRRDFHPQIKVIDAAAGLVEYVASDETVDCYREVVMASGWDFSRFEKNAPFVDSHNYTSIDCLLGKVVNFEVKNRQLIETVKWAIDVPSNVLAIKGFAMTQAGYLKAVSVGFIPQKTVSRFDNDPGDFNDALESLDLGTDAESIRCIYLSQLQTELSCCVIGANPSAVVMEKAYKDGILDDRDLERWPAVRTAIESLSGSRSYIFSQSKSTAKPAMSKSAFADEFQRLTGDVSKTTTDKLESARRGQSEAELFRAAGQARLEMASARRRDAEAVIGEILSCSERRAYYNALPRLACGVRCYDVDTSVVRKSLTVAPNTFGGSMLPTAVSKDIFDLVLIYGAFRDLGVTPMPGMQTKFPKTTANPTAYWLTPTRIGNTITADTTLTGTYLTPEANTLAILLQVSRELLQDEKADLSHYLLSRFSQGIAAAIDYAAFQGNGVDDTTNGAQTGIFIDGTISSVNAAQGNTTINQLARADFLAAIAAVNPAALQRPCRWFINPSFIASLLTLVDSEGKSYLLKTPGETGDGQWYLTGFPVTWAAQAPATNAAGAKIAAFGHGPSYMIAMREELEVMLANGATGFQSNANFFRALARGFVQTRESTGIVTLALAVA